MFFKTMLSLIEKLLVAKTYYCGTIAKCRQLPPGFSAAINHNGEAMKRGTILF